MATMRVVDYYIHGHGRGHASRAVAVLERLRARGCQVRVFAGGEAEAMLEEPFIHRAPVMPGPSVLVRLPWRIAQDVRRYSRDRPDLIVSDGDQGAIGAGRGRGIPTIAVGHGLIFAGCRLPTGLPRRSIAHQLGNTLIPTTLARHRVAVHFLPAEPRGDNVRVARPDLPSALLGRPSDDGFVLAYFSFGKGERVVSALRAAGAEVVAYGAGEGVRAFDRAGFRADLLRCRAVASSAGSNVLAECVALQKPVLALFEPSHHEQTLNAVLIEKAEVGLAASFDDFRMPEGAAVAARFVARASAKDFWRVPLLEALPPVSDVVDALIEPT